MVLLLLASLALASSHPMVGYQPDSALPYGPALLGGNETAILMRSRTSSACGDWLPPGLEVISSHVPFFRYATAFMVRCGHAVRGTTVVSPADDASASAFRSAGELFRGPFGACRSRPTRACGAAGAGTCPNRVFASSSSLPYVTMDAPEPDLRRTPSSRGSSPRRGGRTSRPAARAQGPPSPWTPSSEEKGAARGGRV